MPAERSSHPFFSLELSDYVDDSVPADGNARQLLENDAAWEARRVTPAPPLHCEQVTGQEAASTARNGWS